MKQRVFLLIFVFLVVGCGDTTYKLEKSGGNSGLDLGLIQVGKTTQAHVRRLFGMPALIQKYDNSSEKWVYEKISDSRVYQRIEGLSVSDKEKSLESGKFSQNPMVLPQGTPRVYPKVEQSKNLVIKFTKVQGEKRVQEFYLQDFMAK